MRFTTPLSASLRVNRISSSNASRSSSLMAAVHRSQPKPSSCQNTRIACGGRAGAPSCVPRPRKFRYAGRRVATDIASRRRRVACQPAPSSRQPGPRAQHVAVGQGRGSKWVGAARFGLPPCGRETARSACERHGRQARRCCRTASRAPASRPSPSPASGPCWPLACLIVNLA